MVPLDAGYARDEMIQPDIMAPPLEWLVSDAAASVTGQRFLAVHWDPALAPEQAAEKAGAPVAWTAIATMPIEPRRGGASSARRQPVEFENRHSGAGAGGPPSNPSHRCAERGVTRWPHGGREGRGHGPGTGRVDPVGICGKRYASPAERRRIVPFYDTQTAGRLRMSAGTLRGRNCPSERAPFSAPPSTTILPRSIVRLGQAARSRPSHGE